MALSGDGRLAVSASSDETLKVWEVAGGQCLRTLEGSAGFRSCAAALDFSCIVAGDDAGAVHFIEWVGGG